MLYVEISRTDSRSFLVSSWYRPPNSAAHLLDCYEYFIQKCDVENKKVIITRDLNCDVLKPQLDSHFRKLEFLSSLYEFDQLINCPTRVTETSATPTAIDLVLTNRAENIVKVGTVDLGISDHSLIFAFRKGRIYKSQKNSRYFRNFKRFRSDDFLNDLSLVPWETVAQHEYMHTRVLADLEYAFPPGPLLTRAS